MSETRTPKKQRASVNGELECDVTPEKIAREPLAAQREMDDMSDAAPDDGGDVDGDQTMGGEPPLVELTDVMVVSGGALR